MLRVTTFRTFWRGTPSRSRRRCFSLPAQATQRPSVRGRSALSPDARLWSGPIRTRRASIFSVARRIQTSVARSRSVHGQSSIASSSSLRLEIILHVTASPRVHFVRSLAAKRRMGEPGVVLLDVEGRETTDGVSRVERGRVGGGHFQSSR